LILTRLRALKARATGAGHSIKKGVRPSFIGVARVLLRLVLAFLICLASPFLLVFALFHDYLMKKFINYAYIYNVSWEDPRMDQQVCHDFGDNRIHMSVSDYHYSSLLQSIHLQVFHLKENDHVITIASAGCNVLDYIIEGARVTAVDFNACQIALTELKAVAIKELTFEQVFAIFGKNNVQLLRELYPTHLRRHLSPLAVEFWDGYVKRVTSFMYSGKLDVWLVFSCKKIWIAASQGECATPFLIVIGWWVMYMAGTSGFLAFLAFRVVFPLLHLGWIRQAIQERITREEFIALCHEHDSQVLLYGCHQLVACGCNSSVVWPCLIVSCPFHFSPQIAICSWILDTLLPCFALFAGVPKRQMNLGLGRENFSVIVNHVLFNTDLVHDNYFYAGKECDLRDGVCDW